MTDTILTLTDTDTDTATAWAQLTEANRLLDAGMLDDAFDVLLIVEPETEAQDEALTATISRWTGLNHLRNAW